jgi:hypothetical protein
LASQASTSKSALSPARQRINSSCHRARPTPGTGNGAEGSAPTRQRVTDAVGCPKSAASGVAAPAADGEADGARAFGGELKAAGGRHGEPRDFCYDSAKAAVPQAFLETDVDRRLVPRFDIDHAIGDEPGLGEGRGEEVPPNDAPQRPAAGPSGDSRRKERRGGAVDRAFAAAGHLMPSAERQAARQMPVDCLKTEGQHQTPAAGRAFEASDPLAKLLDPGTDKAHVLGTWLGGPYVLYLFPFVEMSQSESDGGSGTGRLDL